MSYESGIVVAGLIKVYQIFMLAMILNSTRHRNLRRIGLRLSWMTSGLKPMTSNDYKPQAGFLLFKIFAIVAYSLLNMMFSWVFVFYFACLTAYQLSKNAGMPQNLKEMLWKLNNVDMSKAQVIEAFAAVENFTPEKLQQLRDEVEGRLSEDPNYKHAA
ncbi:hypothetical protein BH10BDE1_BH10BDE1_27900 [soil metagenome]